MSASNQIVIQHDKIVKKVTKLASLIKLESNYLSIIAGLHLGMNPEIELSEIIHHLNIIKSITPMHQDQNQDSVIGQYASMTIYNIIHSKGNTEHK